MSFLISNWTEFVRGKKSFKNPYPVNHEHLEKTWGL